MTAYELRIVYCQEDLTELVKELGFLPFFGSNIMGFSIGEATPIEVWQKNLGLGPWLWRDDIAKEKECIYGKFFNKKTGYVSTEWFPHLANYRRNGYDFDALFDDGLARYDDKHIYDIIESKGPITAPQLKKEASVDRKKTSRFDGIMTRLQMMTYIVPVDFIFPKDEYGNKKYSYGITVYDTPEHWLGYDFCTSQYKTPPKESLEFMVQHLMKMLPDIDRDSVVKLLK